MSATTIRLSDDLSAEAALIARVEGITVSEVIRRALADWIEARRADPKFQARLRERVAADRAILERLS